MDKDDKLVLLEHLRQLNDTLTRLSSRRRRLRAERRVRLGQLKNTMTFILSFVLTALAAVLAFFGLLILPIDKIIIYVGATALAFFITLYLLIYYSVLNRDLFSKRRWVQKRLQPMDAQIKRMDMEIRSLLSAPFLDDVALDAKFVDKNLLADAREMVMTEPEITWVEIERRLNTEMMLKRTRRQSLFASEWYRVFGASFPEKLRA
ncbi:hypothetical protein [Weissella confusa]|uniref:hypothetical protein n=1 Tax=Weissella confusa TaxID=1583 RepID=UPI0018F26022|nr:hypothetical protein [Weissella confusa]MBJ7686440.1 hypothetical protein [Weissella confusa]MBJ7696836.1 hypothetical protein [Weissella confusa]